MLEPSERQLLADMLRPPAGYSFDRAISTTYTLDLLTLLTLPVAFMLQQWAGNSERPKVDPLALLQALRRHARHIHVFCEAGRTSVPKSSHLLFGYLEDSVHEAAAPKGGAFHPKITIVRYLRESSGDDGKRQGKSVFYRFLCGSRNLTFDRSWDTMLNLEGEVAEERTNAFSRNRPLSDFVKRLPELAVRPLRHDAQYDIELVADELLRVRFEGPEGLERFKFWPLGLDRKETWPFASRTDNILVLSPFADADFLSLLSDQTKGHVTFVSRPETIDALPEDAGRLFADCFVLNDAAEALEPQRGDEPSTDMGPGPINPDEIELQPAVSPLRGLHAKVYIADGGWGATLWTGSANATTAAFTRNVEFLVELNGTKNRHGVQSLLGEVGGDTPRDRRVLFRDLLVRYEKRGQTPPDPIEVELERALDSARKAIVEADLRGDIKAESSTGDELYSVALRAGRSPFPSLPSIVSVRVRPITLRAEAAVRLSLSGECLAGFEALSMESLTRFYAFQLLALREGRQQESEFVLNLPIEGLPPAREANLLLALLANPQRLLRYLLMLLSDGELDPLQFLGHQRASGSDEEQHDGLYGFPLLEPLLRTLSQEPQRLDRIEELLRDLESSDAGRDLVPEGFRAIWDPIWAARGEAPYGRS